MLAYVELVKVVKNDKKGCGKGGVERFSSKENLPCTCKGAFSSYTLINTVSVEPVLYSSHLIEGATHLPNVVADFPSQTNSHLFPHITACLIRSPT